MLLHTNYSVRKYTRDFLIDPSFVFITLSLVAFLTVGKCQIKAGTKMLQFIKQKCDSRVIKRTPLRLQSLESIAFLPRHPSYSPDHNTIDVERTSWMIHILISDLSQRATSSLDDFFPSIFEIKTCLFANI